MRLCRIDHFVLVTANLDQCLAFYRDGLGMDHVCVNGRHALQFGNQKINIHTTYVLQYVVIGVSIAVGLAVVIGIPAFLRRRRKKKARAQAGS